MNAPAYCPGCGAHLFFTTHRASCENMTEAMYSCPYCNAFWEVRGSINDQAEARILAHQKRLALEEEQAEATWREFLATPAGLDDPWHGAIG